MITSLSNAQIKNIGKLLKSAKNRKEQGLYVIEGIKMFGEAKRLGILKKAYISETLYEQWKTAEKDLLQGIEYEIVAYKVFKEVSETVNPQGVLAVVGIPKYTLGELLEQEELRLLFLDNLRDPGNLGTIVRTAEGAGITGIILSKESVDLYNPKTIRATMGSIFRLPCIYVENFIDSLRLAKEKDIVLYTTYLSGKYFYDQIEYANRYGIIIGNEANGISDETVQEADVLVKIPMCGKVESLNAAVAASVMMYETYRQRRYIGNLKGNTKK